MPIFSHRSCLPVTTAEAFAWHSRPGALTRLLPPWRDLRLLTRDGTIHDGDCTVFTLGLGPFHQRWTAVHKDYRAGVSFTDVQEHGPFSHWEHLHAFASEPDSTCTLTDTIDWALPAWAEWLAPGVEKELARTFAWRHRRTAQDLTRHRRHEGQPPLNIAISGASGLIGSALAAYLDAGGNRVLRLVRTASLHEDHIAWNPLTGTIDPRLDGCDALVHLAGAGIADGLWSESRKVAIRLSRIEATRRLCEELTHLLRPPKTLICASAIGFYGDQGDSADESTSGGTGFLAEVCREWEAACAPAINAGIRVVHLRLGAVLAGNGGIISRLRPLFDCGIAGTLGDGSQAMSWIGLDDAVGAIHHLIQHDDLAGPFNLTAPASTTNAEFTDTLGTLLDRPTFFPVPASAVRCLFGEMGESMMLRGRTVMPRRLLESGFPFLTPNLAACLAWELGLPPAAGA